MGLEGKDGLEGEPQAQQEREGDREVRVTSAHVITDATGWMDPRDVG